MFVCFQIQCLDEKPFNHSKGFPLSPPMNSDWKKAQRSYIRIPPSTRIKSLRQM